jgi:hypothetical protein
MHWYDKNFDFFRRDNRIDRIKFNPVDLVILSKRKLPHSGSGFQLF